MTTEGERFRTVESIDRRRGDVLAAMAVVPTQQERENEVLARYGKHPDRIPSGLQAAAEAVRLVARKLVEESASNVVAAEGMLGMLKLEHEQFAAEVTRAADNFAARVSEYMSCGTACMRSIAEHREAIIGVVRKVADDPAMVIAPGEEPPPAA